MTPAATETTVLAAKAAGVRPEIAEQMGLHAECARIAKRLGPRLHYGPEVPSDDHQTQRLFTALGVVMPSTHDWSPNAIAAYYQQFLFTLWPGDSPDPIRDAARAKLIRRLLALPRDLSVCRVPGGLKKCRPSRGGPRVRIPLPPPASQRTVGAQLARDDRAEF